MWTTAYRWLLGVFGLVSLYRIWKLVRYHGYASSNDQRLADSIATRTVEPVELRSTPRVSALVAAWNPEEDLERLIASFRALDYSNNELILAVGGAHDLRDLQHLAGPDVCLVEHPGGGKQRALRRCFEEASGSIIFLTDADCVIESGSFLSLMAPIINGDSNVTTGRHVPFEEQQRHPFVRLQWARTIDSFARVPGDPGVFGANCALTREALEAAGAFEEVVGAGTDVHLSSRLRSAGYHVQYVYESQVRTNYHRSLLPYLRQHSRWLRSHAFNAGLDGDESSVWSWRRESLEAAGFIALTALLLLRRRPLLLLLLAPALRRYLAWLRVLRFAQRLMRTRWRPAEYLSPFAGMYAEALARTIALIDHLVPSRRQRW